MRVDDVQGKEYRALLISTVRTCASDPDENEEGFLSNVKVPPTHAGVLTDSIVSVSSAL